MDADAIRERKEHLVRLIEAITEVQSIPAWSTLKTEFDGEIAKLNRFLLAEAKKKPINDAELYHLQGRIESAKKYSLEKLYEDAMAEHDSLKRKL